MTRRSTVAVLAWLSGSVFALGQAPAQQGQPQGGAAGAFREVTVTAIPGVVSAGARWTLVWQGTDNADGVVGTDDGGLLFAQEQPNRVSKLDRNDNVSIFVESTRGAGALAIDAQGRVLAAQRTCTDPGRSAPCSEPTAIGVVYPERERRILADRFQGQSIGRPNDLLASRRGGVYFTSGGAYYLSPAGEVSSVGENLRANGIVLSPDERVLYVTNGTAIVAFDIRADGAATNQREFAKLEAGGTGDGLAVDGAGRLYVTSMGSGVQVFSPEGEYLGVIPTPRNVISAAFSGPEKRTLYVVGGGARSTDGTEVITPPGVRNNAKSIFKIPLLAQGFLGRAK